ncbi:MAG: hypothetical protein K8R59_17065 [Thermoanaerobaculales bacterium]|nr:hypothetical protein [Thermoanaerobaculales bacterium]
MEWLEQNLDAYRILGEILNDLRQTIQESLHNSLGSKWFRDGIPTAVFDRLVSVKEGETAIDWYESEYQQIMDFAVFPDLFDILLENSESFPHILSLVPSSSLLQARLLELEVLRTKVGRARPVSEAELTFLMKFHTRFRQALVQHRAAQGDSSVTPDESTGETDVDFENQDQEDSAPEVASSAAPPRPTPKPTKAVKPPPSRNPSKNPTPAVSPSDETQSDEPVSTPDPAQADTTLEPGPETLKNALENSDSKVVLRHLFREVTSLAESLWSSDIPPHPAIWSTVRTSTWYEKSFSPLGLKPLSDFFSVIGDVEQRMTEGLGKTELQTLLEEANFAQVLLALRDMFQRNRI